MGHRLDFAYMEIAKQLRHLSNTRSTGGACIVNPEWNAIISSGSNIYCQFNNSIRNIVPEESDYEVHAEANAIIKANGDVKGCILYQTAPPCNECAKLIIQKKIQKVVHLETNRLLEYEAGKLMLDEAGISCVLFTE